MWFGGGLGWFEANMAGRRKKKPFYICSEVIDNITDDNSGCLGCGLKVVLGVLTDRLGQHNWNVSIVNIRCGICSDTSDFLQQGLVIPPRLVLAGSHG